MRRMSTGSRGPQNRRLLALHKKHLAAFGCRCRCRFLFLLALPFVLATRGFHFRISRPKPENELLD